MGSSDRGKTMEGRVAEKPMGFEPDILKMMSEFRVPNLDLETLISTQRRNVEAMVRAQQLALEGAQAVSRRQAEIMRQMMEEMGGAMAAVISTTAPEERAAKQTEMATAALERALANMRELAELVSKSNREAIDVINGRLVESLNEVRNLFERGVGAGAAAPKASTPSSTASAPRAPARGGPRKPA